MKFFKRILPLLVISIGLISISAPVVLAASAPESPLDSFCEEVGDRPICKINEQDSKPGRGLLEENGMFRKILRLLSWITGMLAGIFVIVGGVKLATSGGDAEGVKSARNMILYACIGIVVVVLSNVIINIVLGVVNKVNT